MHEGGGRVDLARGADRGEDLAVEQRRLDLLHAVRHLAEPHHVGPQRACAARRARRVVGQGAVPGGAGVAGGAPRRTQPAVHVVHPPGATPLVQVVDVLRDEEQVVAEVLLEPGERPVGGVGSRPQQPRATLVVEPLHQVGVGLERLGRRDRHRVVALPQPVGVAEGRQPALRRDPRPRQHHHAHVTILPQALSSTRGTATSRARASRRTGRGPRQPRRSCRRGGWSRRRRAAGRPGRRRWR